MLKKYSYSETQITNADDICSDENIISIIPNDIQYKCKYRDLKNTILYLNPGKLKNRNGNDVTSMKFILNDDTEIPYNFFFYYRFLKYVKYGKDSPSGYRFLDKNKYSMSIDENKLVPKIGKFTQNVFYEKLEDCITEESNRKIEQKMLNTEKIALEDIVFDTNKLHLNKIDELKIKERVADYFNNKVKLKDKGIIFNSISINIFLEDLLHKILKEKYKSINPKIIKTENIYDEAIEKYSGNKENFSILLNNNKGQYDINYNPDINTWKIKQLFSNVNTWKKNIIEDSNLSILQKFEHNNLKSYEFLKTTDGDVQPLSTEEIEKSKSHYMSPSFGNDLDSTNILLLEPKVLKLITINETEFENGLKIEYLKNPSTQVTEKISLPLYFKKIPNENRFYAIVPYTADTDSQKPNFYDKPPTNNLFEISQEHDDFFPK